MINRPADERTLVRIPVGLASLEGNLAVPKGAGGIALFAHGSGSSRHSPRNQFVAQNLRQAGLGTFLMDLLTSDEEAEDEYNAALRFNIPLLAGRVLLAADWLAHGSQTRDLRIGYFGASTAAAAALVAAARRPELAKAIVSRGGRPDLAGEDLGKVRAPTLLIVGGDDAEVLLLNQQALQLMKCTAELTVVPGATYLFEEPGTLEEVARHAAGWFVKHLTPEAPAPQDYCGSHK